MPLIQVKTVEEVLTSTQKKELITKLTNAVLSVYGENLRPVTWVTIEEVKSGAWGVGGEPLTTGDVRALQAGTQPK